MGGTPVDSIRLWKASDNRHLMRSEASVIVPEKEIADVEG
jgi:hypothetical protein